MTQPIQFRYSMVYNSFGFDPILLHWSPGAVQWICMILMSFNVYFSFFLGWNSPPVQWKSTIPLWIVYSLEYTRGPFLYNREIDWSQQTGQWIILIHLYTFCIHSWAVEKRYDKTKHNIYFQFYNSLHSCYKDNII